MATFQPSDMTQCHLCGCQVRQDRLVKHIAKVHQKNQKERKSKAAQSRPKKLTHLKIRRTLGTVSKWCRKNSSIGVKENYAKTLSIMTLNKFMGYSFSEINQLNKGKLSWERYESNSQCLINVYNLMIGDVGDVLLLYDQHVENSRQKNGHHSNHSESDSYAVDWRDCNTIDRMDGSKYIGYTRREYEGSRFGSFPIHDDYSDESWADDNPWE